MTSINFKKNETMTISSEVKKGEVYRYWIFEHEAIGTEIKKEERVGAIISNNRLNRWDKRFLIVPLTTKKLDKQYNYEVRTFVDNQHGKALIDQIKTIDKSRLLKKTGQLTTKEMNAISEKLLAIFDLWEYLEEKENFPNH